MIPISKYELEERINDNLRKIRDLDTFSDDPKINKIIRILRQQVARDSLHLTQLEHPAWQDSAVRSG